MAQMTLTHLRAGRRRRPAPGGVPAAVTGERPSASTAPPEPSAPPEDFAGPTDTQVRNWAESAALAGYGPCATDFL
ncbi:hypothetical protein GCM10010129_84220 [Streptomyces fumigatiscleroticus]|nr:hypothetical protein GCM10010129_84220 [Streptomyces fumigatiscleroticus]